jgi:hypothetical protein
MLSERLVAVLADGCCELVHFNVLYPRADSNLQKRFVLESPEKMKHLIQSCIHPTSSPLALLPAAPTSATSAASMAG